MVRLLPHWIGGFSPSHLYFSTFPGGLNHPNAILGTEYWVYVGYLSMVDCLIQRLLFFQFVSNPQVS